MIIIKLCCNKNRKKNFFYANSANVFCTGHYSGGWWGPCWDPLPP